MLWCVGLRDLFREVAGDTAGRWGRGRCCGVWVSGTSSGRWLEIPPVGGGGAGAVVCGSQGPLQGGGWTGPVLWCVGLYMACCADSMPGLVAEALVDPVSPVSDSVRTCILQSLNTRRNYPARPTVSGIHFFCVLG